MSRKFVPVFLLIFINIILCYEKDMTFSVDAGKADCFYHNVTAGQIIDVEYQVIDGLHSDLEISFQLSDPIGRVIVADFKKAENSHRHTAERSGDYKFCFDNTFSTYSVKTIFFDLMIDSAEEATSDYDYDKEVELGVSSETYVLSVREIFETVQRVKDNISQARRMQEQLSAYEARDRNLAEENYDLVMKWSLIQILLMSLVGVMQVVFVKHLFDDSNKLTLWNIMPSMFTQRM